MSDDKNIFDRLKARGEEVLGQVSNELMQNEHFVKAMQGALEGKQKLDQAVGRALKTMNVPTRTRPQERGGAHRGARARSRGSAGQGSRPRPGQAKKAKKAQARKKQR